jgi:hypothetical protein
MTDAEMARMLAESLAAQLASCRPQMVDDAARGGMHPRLVAGVRAARDAFAEHVSENDVDELLEQVKAEVREGLEELERRHGKDRE